MYFGVLIKYRNNLLIVNLFSLLEAENTGCQNGSLHINRRTIIQMRTIFIFQSFAVTDRINTAVSFGHLKRATGAASYLLAVPGGQQNEAVKMFGQ